MTISQDGASRFKQFVKATPLIGGAAQALAQSSMVAEWRRRLSFRGSSSYWEARYRAGGDSGAGSYGRLAQFKAEVLNGFVEAEGIRTVIEFGCGDGAQLELARYPDYVGIDVAETAIELCTRRFGDVPGRRFFRADAMPADLGTFDLALSLDVVYHLVEDAVFESYMRGLFGASRRHVVIYAGDVDAPGDSPHVRHRAFSGWIADNIPGWRHTARIQNRYPYDPGRPDDTSFADFHFYVKKPG